MTDEACSKMRRTLPTTTCIFKTAYCSQVPVLVCLLSRSVQGREARHRVSQRLTSRTTRFWVCLTLQVRQYYISLSSSRVDRKTFGIDTGCLVFELSKRGP